MSVESGADPLRTDNLTPEQRRRCMSRVRTKDTAAEVKVRAELHRRGLRFRKHPKGLPGSPDIVFTRAKLAVFVDGDFWHGRELDAWIHKLSPFWREKIAKNQARDQRDTAELQRLGWTVIRVWEHAAQEDLKGVADAIYNRHRERIEALCHLSERHTSASAVSEPLNDSESST